MSLEELRNSVSSEQETPCSKVDRVISTLEQADNMKILSNCCVYLPGCWGLLIAATLHSFRIFRPLSSLTNLSFPPNHIVC